MTARVLVQVICVLAVVYSCEAQVNLAVDYPETGNYSLVKLTCSDDFGVRLNDAEFLKRVPEQNSLVQLPGSPTDGEITITLTQEEEGYFSCRSGNVRSDEIGLAAEPDENYDGTTSHRYITFPTGDSSREVNLTCPIRPGALSDSYSVQWESSIPGVPGFTIVDTGNYTITEDIHPTSLHQYQCKVTIQYRSDQSGTQTYNGPMIVLNKLVLATVEGEIENVTISRGESAEFTCKFLKGDVDIYIEWSVGDTVFDECGYTEKDIAPDGNGCYTTNTESVLQLQNTSMFNFRSYSVQCVVQQNITDEFKNDLSFQSHFNNVTSSSFLFIENKMDSITDSTETITDNNETITDNKALVGAVTGAAVILVLFVIIMLVVISCCIKKKCAKSTGTQTQPDVMQLSPRRRPLIASDGNEDDNAIQDNAEAGYQPCERRENNGGMAAEATVGTNNDTSKCKEIPESNLVDDLQPVAAQWKSLGLQLKISPATLNVIENQRSYFEEILCRWISGAGIECTKENLIKTLRKECIRENRLATEIEEDKEFPMNFDEEHIGLLSNRLRSVAHNCSLFGCQLGISDGDVRLIMSMNVNVRNCLKEVLCEWRATQKPMLKDVIEAIRSDVIQNKRLATKLEEKWKNAGYLSAETQEEAVDIN